MVTWVFIANQEAHALDIIPVKGFGEVLLPVREPAAAEKTAVEAARDAFLKRTQSDDVSAWETLLAAQPQTPYKLAVLTNVGGLYFRSARFSKCLAAYEAAWEEGKTVRNHPAEPLAGRAAGELAMMYARLGRYESLEQLLKEVEGREFRGPGSNLIESAQSGFELMKAVPETSFRCGPLALSRILALRQAAEIFPLAIRDSASTRQGMSLAQVKEIAAKVGLEKFQVARRAAGAPVLFPAVVHWKVGHYAALVREENGRYLVEDPTFGVKTPIWVTPETLDAESSGYFMVEAATLPAGWTAVADTEAATVWGKGQTNEGDPDRTGPDDHKTGPSSSSSSGSGDGPCGMAAWSVHSMLVSLNIMDRPMGYAPPAGPEVSVLLTYNSRENETISTPVHTSFGPKWSFNGLAWVSDLGGSAIVHGGYGGSEVYYQDVPGQYQRSKRSYAMLYRTSEGPTFERVWPDGTREIFGATGPTGLAYRTKLIDPAGNTLEFQYTNNGTTILLNKMVDEIGQETVFEYAASSTTPTKITDPFGRFTTFSYDAEGRLTSITDVVGITSQFSYKDAGNFIQTLTTPYGSTQFATGFTGTTRWLQATHPNGDLERMEFRHNAEGIPSNLGTVPANMNVSGAYNNFRNALHWDRKAMKDAPGDVSKAHLTHFLHTQAISVTSGLVESEKLALEGRVFFNYEGQSNPNVQSDSNRRTKIGRLLDDGSTQLYQFEYNAAGNPTKMIDPLGRTTLLTYAGNLSDVIEVRQLDGGGASTTLLTSFTYNDQHRPLTITDAAGNTTTLTYNDRGQPLTRVMPNGDTTTFTYDANGYLTQTDGPLAGTVDQATMTYDAKGRLASITDAQGSSLALEYDNLNRLTKRVYADGSYEQWVYDALSLQSYRPRDGSTVTYTHNSLAQITSITDSLSRTTVLDWCRCGDVKMIIDPAGSMTRFFHDVQGRVTGRSYADGSTTSIQYEPVGGRIQTTADEAGRTKSFTYTADNKLASITYGGTGLPVGAATFTWDPVFPRLTSFSNSTGTTTLSYHPYSAGQAGAGRVAAIDGPLANDTATFTYDAAGRGSGRGIDGVMETYSLDAGGRPGTIINPLGTTSYTYDGASTRPLSLTLPGGHLVELAYYDVSALKVLKDIVNKTAGGAEISKFSYTYNSAASVSGITRSLDGGPLLADTASYDAAMRLTSYVKAQSGGGAQTHTYAYDTGNNRISETIGAATTTAETNVLNQVTQLNPPPAAARSYEWDAAGRLGAIVIGTHRSEFSYDAFGRRVRIVEKENGSTVEDRRFVWIGGELAQERDAANTIVKRFFAQGFSTAAGAFFYARDNLGSIREVVDTTGAVRARYDYDPFGRRVKVSGDVDADMGYGSMFYHAPSQLCLAFMRAYDPALGRWIARDAAGETFGFNLYAYVNNDPLSFTDPSGLAPDWVGAGASFAQAAGSVGAIVVTVGVIAAAPVAAPWVVGLGAGLVIYNGMGATFNLVQGLIKLSGGNPIMGAGEGNEFQFNPITEGLHWMGFGGPCEPFSEFAIQGTGVAFDMLTGSGLNAAAKVPALAGKAFAIAEIAGHTGSAANMSGPTMGAAGAAAESLPSNPAPSPYANPSPLPVTAPANGRPAAR